MLTSEEMSKLSTLYDILIDCTNWRLGSRSEELANYFIDNDVLRIMSKYDKSLSDAGVRFVGLMLKYKLPEEIKNKLLASALAQ